MVAYSNYNEPSRSLTHSSRTDCYYYVKGQKLHLIASSPKEEQSLFGKNLQMYAKCKQTELPPKNKTLLPSVREKFYECIHTWKTFASVQTATNCCKGLAFFSRFTD